MFNDLSNVEFFVDPNYELEIYSKLKKTTVKSTIDNYYKYEYFETLPKAELDKTTFSIYTNGASNTKHIYNMQPCPEFFIVVKYLE